MSKFTNFVELLYHSIVPRRPEESKVSAPETVNPVVPKEPLGTVAKYMSREFNSYCMEHGVQCTVTMDPTDYRQIFIFQNNGDRSIRIDHGIQVSYLDPGESTTIKVDGMSPDPYKGIPRLTALPNGNISGWSSYRTHQSSNLPRKFA